MPLLDPNNPLNRPITLSNVFCIIVILILLASNVFFGIKYFNNQKELQQTKTSLETQKTNGQILSFTKLFIEKVLKAQSEVDFETRLKLENAVRNLNDDEVLNSWKSFVDSKTETDAQSQVKNLLELLVDKIKIN